MLCNSLIYHPRALSRTIISQELRIEAGCLKLDASETNICILIKLQNDFISFQWKKDDLPSMNSVGI